MLNSLPASSRRPIASSGAPAKAVSRFRGDASGAAAIEFAAVISFLLLMLLGLCDLAPAWYARTKVQTSAATAADVLGQFQQMQTSDMVSVFSAATDVMMPFSTTNQSLRITNVFSDGNGNIKVYWSCGNGTLPPKTALSAVTTTPTGTDQTAFLFPNKVFVGIWLDGTNTSYVLTEISYPYTAPAKFVLKTPVTLSGVSYYLPRLSAYVGFPWDGTANSPKAPTAATQAKTLTLSNGATCSYAS